jgi:hypothetical protein
VRLDEGRGCERFAAPKAGERKLELAMSEQDDPFTGTWRFNAKRSKLSTPLPQSWVQQIIVMRDEVWVRETIVRMDGSRTVVEVLARFDGNDYPVAGSPVADTIAYKRVSSNIISGIGKRNGDITPTETVTVTPQTRTLTLSYSIRSGTLEVANGIAVFERHIEEVRI